MNIVIIGQGAIGLLWYFKLSQQANNNVTLRCSGKVKNLPKRMTFTDSSQQNHQQIIAFASDEHLQQADLIIYCLKAYALEDAHLQYHPLFNNNATIIFSHNGLIDIQSFALPLKNNQAILAMLMTHGSLKTDHFTITHTGEGHSDIGLIAGNISETKLNKLVDSLNEALSPVILQQDIKEKQWIKLAINCVINPLTAIHNGNNGMITNIKFEQEVQAILQEVVMIALKHEVILSLNDLTQTVFNVAEKTALNCSSMRSDILARRKTEIDHINGFVHQQGVMFNIATPQNTALWQQIKKLESEK